MRGASDFGESAAGSDLTTGAWASSGAGDAATFGSAGASQVSSSPSTAAGGVDDGMVRGVDAGGVDEVASALGGFDLAGAAAGGVDVAGAGEDGTDAAGTTGSASQLSSSSSAVGGGQDTGIERDGDEASAFGATDGVGIPISVPPLPLLRDGGAADGELADVAGAVLGDGIPISVCCLGVTPARPSGIEVLAL